MAKPKSPPKSKKKTVKTTSNSSKPRQLAKPTYKSFRLQKRIKASAGKLPGSFRLTKKALGTMRKYRKLLGGITLVYLVLTVVLANGLAANVDISESRNVLEEIFGGGGAKLSTGLTLFGLMVGSTATGSEAAAVYRSVSLVLVSLATIWGLRQVLAGHPAKLKDAFYKSMYPLVPFVLVLTVIGLQLLPLVLGGFAYNMVFSGGLAATPPEQFVWALIIFAAFLLSLYMISSSIFGLYIVTLPDMTPLMALRSARELVRYRRWTVMRRFVFLPAVLLVVSGLVTIPTILFAAGAAPWVFAGIGAFGIIFTHTYMYQLYRELL